MTDSQSAASRASSRDRRRDLLAAARRLFLSDGYDKTSVAAIVRAAGVAQGTFYLYFKTKEQVLTRLRADVLADYVASWHQGAAGEADADRRLVVGLERVFGAVKRNQDLLRVVRQASSGAETERIWLEGRETLAQPLARLLDEGVTQGRFRVDDPHLAAHLVLSVFDNLLYEALEYRKPAPGKKTLAHATRFTLRALGSDEARVDALVPLKGRRAS